MVIPLGEQGVEFAHHLSGSPLSAGGGLGGECVEEGGHMGSHSGRLSRHSAYRTSCDRSDAIGILKQTEQHGPISQLKTNN